MDSLCWMCLLSFRLYEQIWRVLEVLLHRFHLLIMSHDCLLAIRHKKGKYIRDRGRLEILDCILELHDVFLFGFDVFFFFGLYMLGGDIMLCVLFCFIVSCFTYGTFDYSFIL